MLRVLSFASLALVPLPQDPAPPAVRSLLEAVPTEAVMALAVEDFPAFWSRARSSAWADVLGAEPFAPAWQQLDEVLQEELIPGELTMAELLEAFESAAVYFDEFEGDEPVGGGVAVRLRGDRPRAREVLQVELESGGELVQHDGREAYLLDDGGDGEWIAALDWRDGFALGIASDRERALDKLVALARRLEQGTPDGGLASRLRELRPEAAAAPLQFHLDLHALVLANRGELDEEEQALWELFGLDGLRWLSTHADLGEGVQSQAITRFDLPTSGVIARWAACVRPPPVELARLAPADAIEVTVLGYDFRSAWEDLREELERVLPARNAELEAFLEAGRSSAGIDLESDLIEQLSGEFAQVLVPIDLPRDDPASGQGLFLSSFAVGLLGFPGTSPGSALVVGLHETGPVEDLLESLIEISGAGELVEDEQVAGRWMTSIASPDFPLSPSWAFLDGALVLALRREPVRAVLTQAAEDAPASWLEGQGRREALAGAEGAFAASSGDLAPWLQAEVVEPMAWVTRLFVEGGAVSELGSPDDAPELAATLVEIAEVLPALVAEHLRGTMRTTMTLEAGALVYRIWTE